MSETIYYYNKQFNNYRDALITATNEFLKIIDDSGQAKRTSKKNEIKLAPGMKRFLPRDPVKIPWGVTAPLKGPTGAANLRPGGTTGLNPTIDLFKDRISEQSHNTPLHPTTELKFRWKGAKKAEKERTCPDTTIPSVFDHLPEPRINQPQPVPLPPSPGPWVFPIPRPIIPPVSFPPIPVWPFPELPSF
jgi:hypothetical protein